MAAREAPRYAIYYAPEPGSVVDKFGQDWFGQNGSTTLSGNGAKITRQRIVELTESPRRYGFHGTLKPPFELNPASSREGLLAAARVFARSLSPVEIPPLELAVIG